MSKTKIAVLMGGPSREHEVSLKTGSAMLKHLNTNRYEPVPILITQDLEWFFDNEKTAHTTARALQRLKDDQMVALLALHGTFGEDGVVQALLENYGIPYSGSGPATNLLAMNKILAQLLFEAHGLRVPQTELAKDITYTLRDLRLPVIVKPANEGSSVGVSLVRQEDDLAAALKKALANDHTAMVQEYIKGRETSCGVLDQGGTLHVLPPTELLPVDTDFFDYDAKYSTGGAKEVTPPDMPTEVIARIQAIARQAHTILGCRGYSRTDVIVRAEDYVVLETNTLPGMTATSLLPQQAAAAGISFESLLDTIIEDIVAKKG